MQKDILFKILLYSCIKGCLCCFNMFLLQYNIRQLGTPTTRKIGLQVRPVRSEPGHDKWFSNHVPNSETIVIYVISLVPYKKTTCTVCSIFIWSKREHWIQWKRKKCFLIETHYVNVNLQKRLNLLSGMNGRTVMTQAWPQISSQSLANCTLLSRAQTSSENGWM